MNLYDPRSKENRPLRAITDGEMETMSISLAKELANEVAVIHRATGQHRVFNFRSVGAYTLAEKLLDGTWRLADETEAKTGKEKDEQDAVAAKAEALKQSRSYADALVQSIIHTAKENTPQAKDKK